MGDLDQGGQVASAIIDALNRHGYGLQYSVIRRFEELHQAGTSRWLLEAAEVPVAVNDRDTHIDLVAKHSDAPFSLVVECKREDPALHWCFARAPYTHRNDRNIPIFEVLSSAGSLVSDTINTFRVGDEPYHVALETRSDQTGDGTGARDSIERAVTQVLRGLGGLANMYGRGLLPDRGSTVCLVPVVVTTADLWVTDVDLDAADLVTGKLAEGSGSAEQKDWIWYRYNRSPSLQPAAVPKESQRSVGRIVALEANRTVAVV